MSRRVLTLLSGIEQKRACVVSVVIFKVQVAICVDGLHLISNLNGRCSFFSDHRGYVEASIKRVDGLEK